LTKLVYVYTVIGVYKYFILVYTYTIVGTVLKTIAIISQKGGSGKTTLCVHLAVCAELQNKSTVIIDMDPQASTIDWKQSRANETPDVVPAQPGQLAGLLERARAIDTDLVLIDTAPHSNKAAATAAQFCDLVLIPCRPSVLDIKAIQSTLDILKLVDTKAAIVLNAVPTHGAREDEARDALNGLALIAPVAIYNRVAYFDAMNDGRSVQEYDPNGKAAREIMNLYKWIMK
jgi:chromosome partitioning protein